MGMLEQAWEEREEKIFPSIFGNLGKGIYPLTFDIFSKVFKQESCDPTWLHVGVFQSPPNESRDTWLYVSSGLSNPWYGEVQGEFSGLGTEFVIETVEESPWALNTLLNMVAYNILLAVGRFGDFPLLDYGHRIPLNSSITSSFESNIRNLIITEPTHYPSSFSLCSGEVDLLHFIGITNEELGFAKAQGSDRLVAILIESGVYPVTNPSRDSVVSA